MENEKKAQKIEAIIEKYADKIKKINSETTQNMIKSFSIDRLLDDKILDRDRYERIYFLSNDYKKLTGKVSSAWKKYKSNYVEYDNRIFDEIGERKRKENDKDAYMFSKDFQNEMFNEIVNELNKKGFFDDYRGKK